MGGKFSRADQEAAGGDKSPSAVSRRSISSRLSTRSRRTTKSTEDGASTLPRNFERGKSLSKRFRRSCRNWAAKKGLVEQGKPGRKEAAAEEETKREQEEEGCGKSSEPEEVMEEDDVTEEPEMDVAVIVAELVVEAHRRKLASRAHSKEAIAEKANNVADDDETKEELLQDSERCEEEALATLVETEAVIENQVAPEGGDNTTSSVLEIESERVSDDLETEVPAGGFEESNKTNDETEDVARLSEVGKARAEEEELVNDPVEEADVSDDKPNMTQRVNTSLDEDHEDQQRPLHQENQETLVENKILGLELSAKDSLCVEEESRMEDRPGSGEVEECQTVTAGNRVAGENGAKGEKNEVEEQTETEPEENENDDDDTKRSTRLSEGGNDEDEEYTDEKFDDEGSEKLIEEEKSFEVAEEVENVTEIECGHDFSSDSIITKPGSVNVDQKDLSHGIEEKRRNSENNQNESLSDNCFEETSVQHPVISGLVLTHEQIETECNFDETSHASTSNLSPATPESPVLELSQEGKKVDTYQDANQMDPIEICQETSGSQGMRDADSEGLIGSVELRAADSFVSGMTEAAYVQCTPPPSILVPSISRDQEEDNTTFIGLEVDHDPAQAEEMCLCSKETLPSPESEDDLKGDLDEKHLLEEKSVSPIELLTASKERWSVSEKKINKDEVTDEEGRGGEDDGESTEEERDELQEIDDRNESREEEMEERGRSREEEEQEEEEDNRQDEEEDNRQEDDEDGQVEEIEDEDEVLLAMMARLGCERIVLTGVGRESNPAGQTTSSSLSVLDDEREATSSVGPVLDDESSFQTPATTSGSHTPSQQMQEDHHQPPFSCHDQTDSMLVLNSSFEEEDDNDDDCDFLSEDEDGLMNDGRVVLENIEEEDEEDSVVDAEEVFPSRAPAEIVWDDRGGFSGRVVAQGETEDDTGEDGETEDSTDSEGESSGDPVETSRKNYVEGEWTGPSLMEDRLEPISIESVVTVIGREEDGEEEESNTYLAEGNKMSAMEFLLFQEGSEDLEFYPNEEEMRARDEERRGRDESRSRPTSDFRSSFESFLSISSDGEEDAATLGHKLSRMMIEEGEEEEEVSSDEGIDDNEDEKSVKNETKITERSGAGQIHEGTSSFK